MRITVDNTVEPEPKGSPLTTTAWVYNVVRFKKSLAGDHNAVEGIDKTFQSQQKQETTAPKNGRGTADTSTATKSLVSC